jgi:hypothetical protein
METPQTLQEAIQYFTNFENCREFMVAIRWSDGKVRCPHCDSEKVTYLQAARLYKCYGDHPKPKFSLKVGTVFEDSPIPLEKWLPAVWVIVNCKNGISSYELSRDLGVTQKSAWFMLHRIRLALKSGALETKIGGPDSGGVEVDETFVGGKMKNMNRARRIRFSQGGHTGGRSGKAIVVGMLDRDARQVRAKVLPNVKRETLQAEILNAVEYGSPVFTDKAVPYDNLSKHYVHEVVDHVERYVDGRIHTNGLENFWSLLKRSLKGTYVCVEPFHLERYVDEQVFRYNNRKDTDDAGRFAIALSQIVGKRLTYNELTGKNASQPF